MKEWANSNFKFYSMAKALSKMDVCLAAEIIEAIELWEFFLRMRCTKEQFEKFLDWKDKALIWEYKGDKASIDRLSINYAALMELNMLYCEEDNWLRRWLVNDVIYEHLKVYFDWQGDKVDKLEVNGKILTREELENVEDVDLWHFIEN